MCGVFLMEILDFIIWLLTESFKNLMIPFGILGFSPKRGKLKWGIMIAGILLLIIVQNTGGDLFIAQIFYTFLIVIIFFQEIFGKKIQLFLLQFIAITSVDLLLWSILAGIVNKKLVEGTPTLFAIRWTSEILGCIVWGILCIVLKKYRKMILQVFLDLSPGYYTMLLLVLLGMAFMAGIAQGNVLEELSNRLQIIYLTLSTVVLILLLVLISFFIHTLYVKTQLEMENVFTEKCISLQKSYYEQKLLDDENMRKFRHDFSKHMGILNEMCKNKRIQELERYIQELDIQYRQVEPTQNTGNFIADYFINQVVSELEEQGELECEITGRMPQKLSISNGDLCVLLGNALENVCEALKQVSSERKFSFVVKVYRNNLYIYISNSMPENFDGNLKTTKDDEINHGYGIANMRKIVEKNNGNLSIKTGNGLFCVEIEFYDVIPD